MANAAAAAVTRKRRSPDHNFPLTLVSIRAVSEQEQTDPRLPAALDALKRCGYAVGTSTVSAQGHTMVTVAGRVMCQEDIFRLAGMNQAALDVARMR